MKRATLKQICKKYDLDLLILFGSQTTKFKNILSDIDLAFFRWKKMNPEENNEFLSDMMYFYHREDIDLINITNSKSPLLRYRIFMEGKALFEKKAGTFQRMQSQAYIDFHDFKRFYEEKSKLLDKKLKTLA